MIALPIALMLLSGCTYFETAPGHYVAAPYVVAPPPAAVGAFDRSWTAAVGAFDDQGVRIVSEDRAAGILRGARDAIDVTVSVRTQADGSVRVEFNTAGATSRDPDLINRISRAYDRRMGR
ncbi:MAG: hypothetical protein MUF63_18275 [Rhodobacteraceae bacterium]|jgi:hypothetical protein|nr:hypothetical protein [Paracoccaceae bacterium]